jgi:hypothetical protein
MKTNNKGIGRLKIPLLLLGMVVIFSFGFHTVSAASPSNIYVSTTGSDSSNGQSATHTSTTVGPKKTLSSGVSAVSNGGVITLAGGTYNVKNLVISKSMTINGAGLTKTVITGSNAGRIMTINSGVKVIINGVTFENGKSTYGGAIHNSGSLILKNSQFKNNYSPDYGGAVYNGGTLGSSCVTYTHNTAYNGAGITNDAGSSMTISSSVFTYNHVSGTGSGKGYGGAIYNVGNAYLVHSTFLYNTGFEGATIGNCGNLNVVNSIFSHNTAVSDSGAILTYHGVTTLSYDTFTSNHAGKFGGACYIDTVEGVTDTMLSELIVSHCTFTGNSAGLDGGAIHNYRGKLVISATKFLNNISGRYGGAINNWYGSLACTSNVYTNNIAKMGSTINQWS